MFSISDQEADVHSGSHSSPDICRVVLYVGIRCDLKLCLNSVQHEIGAARLRIFHREEGKEAYNIWLVKIRFVMAQGQNVSGQNVSATKRIGTKRIAPKRIAYKTYRIQNVSETKRIGGQNVSATKYQ